MEAVLGAAKHWLQSQAGCSYAPRGDEAQAARQVMELGDIYRPSSVCTLRTWATVLGGSGGYTESPIPSFFDMQQSAPQVMYGMTWWARLGPPSLAPG